MGVFVRKGIGWTRWRKEKDKELKKRFFFLFYRQKKKGTVVSIADHLGQSSCSSNEPKGCVLSIAIDCLVLLEKWMDMVWIKGDVTRWELLYFIFHLHLHCYTTTPFLTPFLLLVFILAFNNSIKINTLEHLFFSSFSLSSFPFSLF